MDRFVDHSTTPTVAIAVLTVLLLIVIEQSVELLGEVPPATPPAAVLALPAPAEAPPFPEVPPVALRPPELALPPLFVAPPIVELPPADCPPPLPALPSLLEDPLLPPWPVPPGVPPLLLLELPAVLETPPTTPLLDALPPLPDEPPLESLLSASPLPPPCRPPLVEEEGDVEHPNGNSRTIMVSEKNGPDLHMLSFHPVCWFCFRTRSNRFQRGDETAADDHSTP